MHQENYVFIKFSPHLHHPKFGPTFSYVMMIRYTHRIYSAYCLTGVVPDVLQQTVLLGQSVQGVVSLTSTSNVAAQGVGGVGTGNGSALGVNVRDVDLDRCVVLGLDDSVSGRALSGNV